MAITLTYPADPRLQAQAAYLAGQGQFAQQQDQFRQGVDQFALNLGQRQSEFDRSYALDQAKFGYGQFDDARRFGEGQRQFDLGYGLDNARFQYGMYNDGRTFDEGVRRFDLGFGEQVRQTDIDNQFRDVKFADDQAQFGANLGLQYDRMAQEQFQREQAMAFEAQQQAQRLQASFAEQQSAQAQQRWGAYQQLEAQRFGVFAKQGMAELDILRNKNFRTPELRQQAFEQWQQQYGQYLPAPIDVGEPPAVQDPWEAMPRQDFQLPDGSTVPIFIGPDGKIDWNGAKMQIDAAASAATANKAQQDAKIKQNEATQKATEKFRSDMYRAAVKVANDHNKTAIALRDDLIRSKVAALEAANKAKTDALNAKAAEDARFAGDGATPKTYYPDDISAQIRQVHDEENAKYRPMTPDAILQAHETAQMIARGSMGGGQGKRYIKRRPDGLYVPRSKSDIELLDPGDLYIAPDKTVREKR